MTDAERQFEIEASTMSRDQLYELAKRQAVEIAQLEKQDRIGTEKRNVLVKTNRQLYRELAEARGRLGLAQFSSSHRETREWDCWSCRDKEPDERHGWTLERWIAEAAKKD